MNQIDYTMLAWKGSRYYLSTEIRDTLKARGLWEDILQTVRIAAFQAEQQRLDAQETLRLAGREVGRALRDYDFNRRRGCVAQIPDGAIVHPVLTGTPFRICRCGETSQSEFAIKRNSLDSTCKQCKSEMARKWYAQNRDRKLAYQKARRNHE